MMMRILLSRLKAQLEASSPVVDERTPIVELKTQSVEERDREMQQWRAEMRQDMEHQVSLHKSMSEQAMACIKADFERKVCFPTSQKRDSFINSSGSQKKSHHKSLNTVLQP